MQRGDKLIVVRDARAQPEIAMMIAALVTLGIPLDDDCPYQETREIVNGREQRVSTWVLKSISVCGQFETQKMIDAWNEKTFCHDNPEHPMAYIKQAFVNHSRLTQAMQTQPPIALIRRGKRLALIPFDASSARREELLAQLES